jgi:putative Mn2+ efflux pump MntP
MSGTVLLISTVGAVGILHTLVPDHWLPISILARRRGWNAGQTASAAATAGIGHTLSTLLLGVVMWIAGAAAAQRLGHAVSYASSGALVAFGLWILISGVREAQEHHHDARERTALLLILGSSPMVEGLPAFFAAGKYGSATLAAMSVVFSAATIVTYVTLSVWSFAAFERVKIRPLELYGEAVSGALVMLVGIVFAVWQF